MLAKELLNPDDSVLDRDDRREGVPAAWLAAGADVSRGARSRWSRSSSTQQGTRASDEFSRVDEYVYFVLLGECQRRCNALGRPARRAPGKSKQIAGMSSSHGRGTLATARAEPVLPALHRSEHGPRSSAIGDPLLAHVERRRRCRHAVTVACGLADARRRDRDGLAAHRARRCETRWVEATSRVAQYGTTNGRYVISLPHRRGRSRRSRLASS